MMHANRWVLGAALAILAVGTGCKQEQAATEPTKKAEEKPAAAAPDVPIPAVVEDTGPASDGPTLAERLAPPSDVAAPPEGAEKTKSGIVSRVLKPGTGESKPGERDTAIVNYTAWTNDGKVKDSTWKRGEPRSMKLQKTKASWSEAIQLMTVGEQRRVWIPIADALKTDETEGTLVIDLELVGLHKAPPAPPDVARPPKDATRRSSGLAWKTVKAGTGTEHPTPTTTVTVRYSGWTTDGLSFDRTLGDETTTFDLANVISGWTEGIPLMVVGETARFWIPEKLAYAGKAGKPKGMLVFDVELVSIAK